MVNGLAQNLRPDGKRLFTTHFDDFSYNISSLISADAGGSTRWSSAHTADLILRPRG